MDFNIHRSVRCCVDYLRPPGVHLSERIYELTIKL